MENYNLEEVSASVPITEVLNVFANKGGDPQGDEAHLELFRYISQIHKCGSFSLRFFAFL